MKDKFRKGGGEFRKNHRISDPKGGIFLKVGFCLKILRFKYYKIPKGGIQIQVGYRLYSAKNGSEICFRLNVVYQRVVTP